MRKTVLYTIGYQATTVPDFLATLTDAGVELLVDVRRVAMSRRPGFAKSSLRANLAEAGIEYLHLRAVGTPAEGRAAAHAGHHEKMKRIFLDHLETEEAQNGLAELQQLLQSPRPLCIMCFEHDPTHCHRTFVADALSQRMKLRVVHLMPEPAH